METGSWQMLATALALGAASGAAFWLLSRLGLLVARSWRRRLPFASELLAEPAAREAKQVRRIGEGLLLLYGAFLVLLLVAAMVLLLLPPAATPDVPGWLFALGAFLAAALVCAAGWHAWRLIRARRELQFTRIANAAIGNVLKRLNVSGNRVFHDVVVEGTFIDHVVVGPRGVFAVNVVARPMPRSDADRPAVELRNGKLSLGNRVEALPVGEAARNMTLLSGALSKLVGHRVVVRSVLAVPGWHSIPRGEANHLLLNENNLPMLPSWNNPDAFLMDEDVAVVQQYLQEASRVRRLD